MLFKYVGTQKPPRGHELSHFLCMEVDARDVFKFFVEKGSVERAYLSRTLACYALFRTHNALRSGALAVCDSEHAFGRYLYEGKRGHFD